MHFPTILFRPNVIHFICEVIKLITTKKPEFRNAMIRKGYTGAGLATAAGLTQGYVSYVMRGKRSILPPTAKRICEVLECEFDDVFSIEGGEK